MNTTKSKEIFEEVKESYPVVQPVTDGSGHLIPKGFLIEYEPVNVVKKIYPLEPCSSHVPNHHRVQQLPEDVFEIPIEIENSFEYVQPETQNFNKRMYISELMATVTGSSQEDI